MKFLEVRMKNLNEPHRGPEDIKSDNPESKSAGQPDAEVISLQDHRSNKGKIEHPLIPKRQIEELRAHWTTIQAAFVDEPKTAVQDAEELVSAVIKQIAEAFRDQREQLEGQWTQGSDVST